MEQIHSAVKIEKEKETKCAMRVVYRFREKIIFTMLRRRRFMICAAHFFFRSSFSIDDLVVVQRERPPPPLEARVRPM